jgi:putative glycosyltransferase (TIGR04372 family)
MWRLSYYFYKVRNLFTLILFFPFSIIFFFLIIFVSPLIQIRIGMFRSDKLGHLSLDYEIYLEEKKKNLNTPNKKFLDLWFKHKFISNFYLYNIRKRQINLVPNIIFEGVFKLIKFLNLRKFIIERENPDADINYVLNKTKSNLIIENEQEFDFKYEKILEKFGYNKDLKIVLLNIRDSAFRGMSSFTDYRNIYNYENYHDSINYLIKNNYFLIRVGRHVKHKFNFKENFIDYPFSKFRSDQMDLYMAKKCNFCISTGSGFDGLVRSYRNPVLFTNFLPHGYFNSYGKKNMTIFKHLIDKKGNKISLNRMLDMNIINNLDGEIFLKNKISFQENSPEEILSATKNMINYVNNNFEKSKNELDKLIEDFYTIKLLNKYGSTSHKKIYSIICPNFLSSNKYLFD